MGPMASASLAVSGSRAWHTPQPAAHRTSHSSDHRRCPARKTTAWEQQCAKIYLLAATNGRKMATRWIR